VLIERRPKVMSIIRRFHPFVWLLLVAGLFACQQQAPLAPAPTQAGDVLSNPTSQARATVAPAVTQTAEPTLTPTLLPPTATATAVPTWPPPLAVPDPFAPLPLTADEVRTAGELAAVEPPARDDLRLAREYRGVTTLPPPAETAETLSVGERAPFNVLNTDSNIVVPITATLLGTSEHAYFWFDDTAPQPEREEMVPVEVAFDEIYEGGVKAFGAEDGPDREGDGRVHILHASPAALCDEAEQCGIAGYFSAHDSLPRAVSASSNERKMFVMNADKFGTGFYLNVLAHEFRHMIEENHDPADIDWEVEGSATLAEELAGFTENAHSRGNAFLAEPDQQLNRWTDGNTYTYYGQGYVLNRYIYDRLGPDLYRAFAMHPADGLAAVTAVAEANGLDLSGERLWLEWLAALAIHDHPQAPTAYRLGDGSLDTVTMTTVTDLPAAIETTVNQYAADYYHLQGSRPVTVTFKGTRRVPLLDTAPPSGGHFWYANRANYSDLRLARPVDLRPVVSATLIYSVWHDIEYGYDFAYLSASTDGGESWEPLVAEQMQGLLPADNPAGKALAGRFYTGESDGWIGERVDLTPYAGQEIWIRFSYVTDPILTFDGPVLDNISIPEIGFYDGAEDNSGGWQAEGFTRATASLPQEWHLQLITFPDGRPVVTPLALDEGQTLTQIAPLADSSPGGGEAILIVAATAPLTLESAAYRLEIRE